MSWIPGTVDSRLLLLAPTETIVSNDTMTLPPPHPAHAPRLQLHAPNLQDTSKKKATPCAAGTTPAKSIAPCATTWVFSTRAQRARGLWNRVMLACSIIECSTHCSPPRPPAMVSQGTSSLLL